MTNAHSSDRLDPKVARPFGVSLIAAAFFAFGVFRVVQLVLFDVASARASNVALAWVALALGNLLALAFLGAYFAYAIWIWRGEPVGRTIALALAWFLAVVTLATTFFALQRWNNGEDASATDVANRIISFFLLMLAIAALVHLFRRDVKAYFSTLEAARRRLSRKRARP